jgi:hypothetical protein
LVVDEIAGAELLLLLLTQLANGADLVLHNQTLTVSPTLKSIAS